MPGGLVLRNQTTRFCVSSGFWWIKPEELSTRVLWSPVMRKLDMTSAPPYESELP